jgi:hypothetical protein
MYKQWFYYSAMAPRCCDGKLLYTMSGNYGQSGQCSPILVQGTATIGQGGSSSVSTTFQQDPQSGDSIVLGCLGNQATSFTALDNEQIQGYCNRGQCNTYNSVVSTDVTVHNSQFSGTLAQTYLFAAAQVVSNQAPPPSFTVSCSNTSVGTMDAFALEYADLSSGDSLDGAPKSNSTPSGVSPLSCGSLTTSANNDLIASLYSYNEIAIPSDSVRATPADPNQIAPTLGTVPQCAGGQGGYCIEQPPYSQSGGMSVYPMQAPGQYSEAWTGPLCNPISDFCFNPLACVSAAFKVIGP